MRCTPLEPFGARLHLDPTKPVDVGTLRRDFQEHGLLLVRGEEIDDALQIALLAALGRVEPDPEGRPMRMEVTNEHDLTTAPEGELVFHYDYAYDPAPIEAISMYGATIEAGATPTLFASSHRALARLPSPLEARLRKLEARHGCFLSRWNAPDEPAEPPEPLISRAAPGWGPNHYWADHPVIWHNRTGVETLFVCLQHTQRILGMSRAESDSLLEELYTCLYDSQHVYVHGWEPGDLLIWDNRSVQHYAVG